MNELGKRHETSMYSFGKLPPTQDMPTVSEAPVSGETMTLKTLMSTLVERNINAWTCLPQKVKDLMLENPSAFRLINKDVGIKSVPDIIYQRVRLEFQDTSGYYWVLSDLI